MMVKQLVKGFKVLVAVLAVVLPLLYMEGGKDINTLTPVSQ